MKRKRKIRKAKRDLAASGNHAPTFEEIAEASGVSLEHVENHALLDETVVNVASLDAPVGEDGNMTLADMLPAQEPVGEDSDITLADMLPVEETDIDLTEVKLDLRWLLSLLPDVERYIFTRTYGLPVKLTRAELGAILGRSESWVRQVHGEALAALQRLGRALTGSVGQAYEAVNNPQKIMKLRPVRVPKGISFVDGRPVKKEPVTEAVQLYFDF